MLWLGTSFTCTFRVRSEQICEIWNSYNDEYYGCCLLWRLAVCRLVVPDVSEDHISPRLRLRFIFVCGPCFPSSIWKHQVPPKRQQSTTRLPGRTFQKISVLRIVLVTDATRAKPQCAKCVLCDFAYIIGWIFEQNCYCKRDCAVTLIVLLITKLGCLFHFK
jgi:hypothetical protein